MNHSFSPQFLVKWRKDAALEAHLGYNTLQLVKLLRYNYDIRINRKGKAI